MRGLPSGESEVTRTEFDFSKARLVGPTVLDTGYCGLSRASDGTARVELDDARRSRNDCVGRRRFRIFHGVHGRQGQ